MTDNNEKVKILISAYENALNFFETDKELLSKIVGSISIFNIDIAFELWQRMLIELENETRGKNFNAKRVGDYYEIISNDYNQDCDDYNFYLCMMCFEKLKIFQSQEMIFNNLLKHPILIEKLFSKENVIDYVHTDFIQYLFLNNECDYAISLLFKFREMAYIIDKTDIDEEDAYIFTHATAIRKMLRYMDKSTWEKVRISLYNTIAELNIKDPLNEIRDGIHKRMKERVDSAQCTLDFVKYVSAEDYDNADKAFALGLNSIDFDFDIYYFFYHSVQKIKIDSWMKCDNYIFDLLDRNINGPLSEKLESALNRKETLKNNRMAKSRCKEKI